MWISRPPGDIKCPAPYRWGSGAPTTRYHFLQILVYHFLQIFSLPLPPDFSLPLPPKTFYLGQNDQIFKILSLSQPLSNSKFRYYLKPISNCLFKFRVLWGPLSPVILVFKVLGLKTKITGWSGPLQTRNLNKQPKIRYYCDFSVQRLVYIDLSQNFNSFSRVEISVLLRFMC